MADGGGRGVGHEEANSLPPNGKVKMGRFYNECVLLDV